MMIDDDDDDDDDDDGDGDDDDDQHIKTSHVVWNMLPSDEKDCTREKKNGGSWQMEGKAAARQVI